MRTTNIHTEFNQSCLYSKLLKCGMGKRCHIRTRCNISYPTTIGDKNYFNIGYTAKLVPQLRGTKPQELIASVDRYDIFQYKFVGDTLEILAPDQKFIRTSIKAGKIKGKDAKTDDTSENIIKFIKSVGQKMFPKKFRYTRVKDPESPGKKPAPAKKPAKGKAPAKPAKSAKAKTPAKKPA
jgi:hypothetical protein